MRRILALDIALATGYAVGEGAPENTFFGTEIFHKHSADNAVLGRHFSEWLSDLIQQTKPQIVAIERPFFRGMTSAHLTGLAWEAHREAEYHNVARVEYSPTTIKKFITGSGKAEKDAVMKAIRNKGFKVLTDHEADAIALLLLHQSKAGAAETGTKSP